MSRCRATSRSTGSQCGNRAIAGMAVCYMHGGKSPAAQAAAARRIAHRDAHRTLARQGVVEVDDPVRALIRIASEAVALYELVHDYLANTEVDHWTRDDGTLSEHVKLLERTQAQAQRFLSDWIRLGLEDRLVRLSERQAEAIGRVIDGVLNELGVDEETLRRAREELPRQLRLASRGS